MGIEALGLLILLSTGDVLNTDYVNYMTQAAYGKVCSIHTEGAIHYVKLPCKTIFEEIKLATETFESKEIK